MTFKEKLRIEHSNDLSCDDECYGCPYEKGYDTEENSKKNVSGTVAKVVNIVGIVKCQQRKRKH